MSELTTFYQLTERSLSLADPRDVPDLMTLFGVTPEVVRADD